MIDYTFPTIIGGEDEVVSERELAKGVQSGLMMNGPESVRFIVIHCSATRCDRDHTVEQLLRDHKARGFRTIGYHFYIRKSGEVSQHRKLLEVGAHAKGYNRCSIGICYEGGLTLTGSDYTAQGVNPGLKRSASELCPDGAVHPADTRTPEQKAALLELLQKLHRLFPQALILGHRDLPGVSKACPCFHAGSEYSKLFPPVAKSETESEARSVAK